MATPLLFELRHLQLQAYGRFKQELLQQGDARKLAAGADIYRTIGDRVSELEVLERLLGTRQGGEDEALTRVRLARLRLLQNDLGRATAVLAPVAVWARANGHRPLSLDVLLEQGYAQFCGGDCRSGRRVYERAFGLLERLRLRLDGQTYLRKRLAALRGRGCLEHNADDNATCLECHREALAIARQLGDSVEEAVALVNLADAYWGCGQYGLALRTYRRGPPGRHLRLLQRGHRDGPARPRDRPVVDRAASTRRPGRCRQAWTSRRSSATSGAWPTAKRT